MAAIADDNERTARRGFLAERRRLSLRTCRSRDREGAGAFIANGQVGIDIPMRAGTIDGHGTDRILAVGNDDRTAGHCAAGTDIEPAIGARAVGIGAIATDQ